MSLCWTVCSVLYLNKGMNMRKWKFNLGGVLIWFGSPVFFFGCGTSELDSIQYWAQRKGLEKVILWVGSWFWRVFSSFTTEYFLKFPYFPNFSIFPAYKFFRNCFPNFWSNFPNFLESLPYEVFSNFPIFLILLEKSKDPISCDCTFWMKVKVKRSKRSA